MCEDRYTAIRWAIAAAQKGDVVVIAGKGDKDWTEVSDGEDGYIRVCLHLFCWVPLLNALVTAQAQLSGLPHWRQSTVPLSVHTLCVNAMAMASRLLCSIDTCGICVCLAHA